MGLLKNYFNICAILEVTCNRVSEGDFILETKNDLLPVSDLTR